MLDPQAREPTFPTVVPAKDFDPDKDAARIETAIKTKGKLQHAALMAEQKQISAPFCSSLSTDEELVFVSQHSGLKGFDHTGNTSQSAAPVLAQL